MIHRRPALLASLLLLGCPAAMDPDDAGPDVRREVGTDARPDAADVARADAADVSVRDDVADDAADVAPLDVPGDEGADAALDAPGDATVDAARDAAGDGATDACVPRPEVCNGRDDNCDGAVDETGCPGHLLISEIVSAPNDGEFVEIYNPTTEAIALDDVYLTDYHAYARVFASSTPATVSAFDFVARFPAGATIPPGGYQTVATGNPGEWVSYYGGVCPTYHLQPTAALGLCTASIAMRPMPGVPGAIGMTATLTNTGEPVTLFRWDGRSDTVQDLDYVYYGTPDASNPAVDKSMLAVDGPDPDAVPSGYRLDTPPHLQERAPVHALSAASNRCDTSEGRETLSGGNGVHGHNETSENLSATWAVTSPTLMVDGGSITMINATPNAANLCP